MFTRLLTKPKQSILLLDPRGTGKSTWIQAQFPQTSSYDLLDSSKSLRLSKNPSLLPQILAMKPTLPGRRFKAISKY